ncbi:MAG: rhomboid family intramembrane serine protease [Halioglobus sp.]|nr:rhomboid family intramembrane serine protease [Halioglobus sp.]
MSDYCQALNVPLDEDLAPLAALLQQHGVVHRIFEREGRQVVMVLDAGQAEQVKILYEHWRGGRVKIDKEPLPDRRGDAGPDAQWRSRGVTLLLIGFCVLGFLLVYLRAPMDWIALLTYAPFEMSGEQIRFGEMHGQYWRLVTPVFLHFGWLHIVFNSLWLWELGGRIEQAMGHFNLLMLFFVIAIVSNTAQYAFGGPSLFGGMSGVVYGLLGFSWVAPLLQPNWQIQPSRAIMVIMVGWLLLCMVGVIEVLGFGAIANAAHLGGLLSGMVLGVAFGALSRAGSDKT